MLKLLYTLFAPASKVTPMVNKQKPPASLAELRPNTGAAPAFAVAHQSPFPWLNTVAFLPAAQESGPDLMAGPVLEAI